MTAWAWRRHVWDNTTCLLLPAVRTATFEQLIFDWIVIIRRPKMVACADRS